MSSSSDFLPSEAAEIFNSAVTPQNIIDSFESTVSDVVSNDGPLVSYTINADNKWGWITLYVVTNVVAVIGNLLFILGSLCTRRSRNTGHYLLMNLSVRDILLAGLCIPFTLDSEVIHMTWNLGLEYCISFRYFYYCFLFFLPLTAVFLAFHLFVENAKWAQSEETGKTASQELKVTLLHSKI